MTFWRATGTSHETSGSPGGAEFFWRSYFRTARGRQGCGSTETRVYSLLRQEEADMFLAGDPPEAYREIPEKASWE